MLMVVSALVNVEYSCRTVCMPRRHTGLCTGGMQAPGTHLGSTPVVDDLDVQRQVT